MNVTDQNGYIASYRGRNMEVYSDTIYHAQLEAAKAFGIKPNKSYLVNVSLCEIGGEPVIHTADF
jgi:hypothetical protein